MKKVMKFVVLMLISIIIGVLIGNMMSQGFILIPLLTVPFPILIFIAVVVLFISVAIHELGHFFWFKIKKIQIRLISIFTLTWIYNGIGWTFQIHPNTITILGGIVIPDLLPITNYCDFKKVQRSYSQALLFAPIISLIQTIISLVIVIMLYYCQHTFAIRFFAVFFSLSAFFGLAIVISSFAKTDSLYGDFRAFKEYAYNDIFAALQIYQYTSFSNDWKLKLKTSNWLEDFFIDYTKKCKDKPITSLDIKIFDWLLFLYFQQVIKSFSIEIENVLYNCLVSDKLFNFPSCEDRDIFFYHLLFYFKKNTCTLKELDISEIYSLNKDKCFKGHPSKLYYEKLAQKILYAENDQQWFENKKNIKPNVSYSLLRIFDSCQESERVFYSVNGQAVEQ